MDKLFNKYHNGGTETQNKKVTFNNPIQEPRVVTNTQFMAQLRSQAIPRNKSMAAPRVVTAVVDKAIGATVTSAHQMITRSQIRLQLEDIVNCNSRTTQTHVTVIEHAMAVIEINMLHKMVHAIFDKE